MSEVGANGAGRLRGALRRLREGGASARPQRFSTILRQLSEGPGDRIALSELVYAFGDRAFGALMFVFAIPNVIPLPPGTSAVLGAPLVLIAGQLAIGRRTLWLPPALLRQAVPRSYLRDLMRRLLPLLRWTERLLAPRFTIMLGPLGDRLIGITCLVLAVILFLPIPLANMVPAFSIAWFSLALIQRDGLAAIIGYLTAVISVAIVVAISGALWLAIRTFFNALGAG